MLAAQCMTWQRWCYLYQTSGYTSMLDMNVTSKSKAEDDIHLVYYFAWDVASAE